MGFWNRLVNALVIAFALFFTVIGFAFLILAATGSPGVGSGELIEEGPAWQKAALGIIFLLAAAPMFYYVFSKSARGLPPAEKRSGSAPVLPPGEKRRP